MTVSEDSAAGRHSRRRMEPSKSCAGFLHACISLLVLILCAPIVSAQVSATLSGIVTDQSGAVVSALGVSSFRIGPEIDPGVPALAADGERPVMLALKSGNFGAPDFYAKALRILEGA